MKSHLRWSGVNVILLALYLSFFHLCLGTSATGCIILGFIFSSSTILVCLISKNVFKNRYEYIFYHFLAVDILIEGFIPLHEGYSFYWCAAGFWLVFILYHFTDTEKLKCLCSKPTKAP